MTNTFTKTVIAALAVASVNHRKSWLL